MKKDIQNEKHPTKDVLMKYRKIIGSAAVVFAMVTALEHVDDLQYI